MSDPTHEEILKVQKEHNKRLREEGAKWAIERIREELKGKLKPPHSRFPYYEPKDIELILSKLEQSE